MSKVDFFIAGAPKSGTTALYTYLSTHPDIFLPAHKEPSFFADDYPNIGGRLKSLNAYEKLYLNNSKKVTGDSSSCYLASDAAPSAIYRYNPDAKIIILLRHPVDLFISEHSQLLYSFYEDIEDPFQAWQMQEKRSSGQHIPASCREPMVLQYRKVCAHGTNLKKYRNIFPQTSILVRFFEDFIECPGAVYRDVLKFIGVPDDHRTDFPKVNEAKFHKRGGIARWLISPPGIFGPFHAKLRRYIATSNSPLIRSIENTARKLTAYNSQKGLSRSLSDNEYDTILKEINNEIRLLSSLTGKELSHWMKRAR